MITSSCAVGKPFIRLGDGLAPVLDYNIPQATCFTIYGPKLLPLDAKHFIPKAYQSAHAPPAQLDVPKLRAELLAGKDLTPRLRLLELIGGTQVMRERAVMSVQRPSAPTPRRVATAGDTRTPTATAPTGTLDEVTERILYILAKGERPIVSKGFDGNIHVEAQPKPLPKLTPRFAAIEEYEVCSYLGNYGAGKTVQTFTLLPGEKTTISVRTYREQTDAASRSENILDSWSASSAREYENTLQEESGNSSSMAWSVDGSVSSTMSADISIPIKAIDLSVGNETTVTASSSLSGTTAQYAKAITTALDKHVTETNSAREIEVNTSSSTTTTTGYESSTVRTLENVNRSRVLNFVFRQLLQEYFTIVYLKDVRFVFSNGDPQATRIVALTELEAFLPTVVAPDKVDDVLEKLLKPYCVVYNHKGVRKTFLEKVTETLGDCPFATPGETVTYYRKSLALTDEYRGVQVNGVILRVTDNVVRTDSVIVDALLGQGEALDCYNQMLQAAAVVKADLANTQLMQTLAGLLEITDPVVRAQSYGKVFGPCCEVESSSTEET